MPALVKAFNSTGGALVCGPASPPPPGDVSVAIDQAGDDAGTAQVDGLHR